MNPVSKEPFSNNSLQFSFGDRPNMKQFRGKLDLNTDPSKNILLLPHDAHNTKCGTAMLMLRVSNKVDIMRFRLQNTTIRYDFSFDGYLVSTFKMTSKLWWACPHQFIIGANFVEKWQRRK